MTECPSKEAMAELERLRMQVTQLQETIHLLRIPGMRESIQDGLETPIDHCFATPGW